MSDKKMSLDQMQSIQGESANLEYEWVRSLRSEPCLH